MADNSRPIKNTAWTTSIILYSFSTPGAIQINPTIAAGDFLINQDQGTGVPGNMGTTPVKLNTSSAEVKLTLSASEMNADIVTIMWVDQTATKEWADGALVLLPAAS